MNKLICCVAVAVAGVGGQAVAAVINVPGDQPTIQAGIDAAVNGDEVVVAPGTYFETINFLGKAITLRSSGGADVTTIDGTGNLHVVQCVSGEGQSSPSTSSRVTFRGGVSLVLGKLGGGAGRRSNGKCQFSVEKLP